MSENHNIWTLGKHVAGSINHAAGSLDKAIYNPTPKPPTWFDLHPTLGPIVAVGLAILVIAAAFVFMLCSTNEKGQFRPQWWWFTP